MKSKGKSVNINHGLDYSSFPKKRLERRSLKSFLLFSLHNIFSYTASFRAFQSYEEAGTILHPELYLFQ